MADLAAGGANDFGGESLVEVSIAVLVHGRSGRQLQIRYELGI